MHDQDADKIKDELALAVNAKTLDYGKILSLSSKLSKYDTKHLRFSANAALIKRLGSELVARQETALSELVKNAYDADATTVEVNYSGTERVGGKLIISDTGVGMSREQLINGFMLLATPDKIEAPKSILYGRSRAGRKGIGRFAAQRLGRKLTLITQTLEAKESITLKINWDDFDRNDELFEIANTIQTTPKICEKGTILIIDSLREAWTDSQISRVYRYILALIQPFPLKETSKEQKSLDGHKKDPGFKVNFTRQIGVKKIPIASEDSMVFDHAVAVVSGNVDENGIGSFTIKAPRLEQPEIHETVDSSKDKKAFDNLRNIRFKAHYFIFRHDLIPAGLTAKIKQLAEQQGGIRLYRNGFRVLPYGEPYNDWLNLNSVEAKRQILPPIANKNWFGFVEIIDHIGASFEETSSREGLTLNPMYDELVDFLHGALKATALRVASFRGRKQTAGQKNFRSLKEEIEDPLETAVKNVESLKESFDEKGNQSDAQSGFFAITKLNQLSENLQKARTKEADLLQELTMLRILSSVGLTIGIFTHEVNSRLIALKSEVIGLSAISNLPGTALKKISMMGNHMEILEAYMAYFDSTISDSSYRTRENQDLSELIYNFWHQFRAAFEKRKIILEEPEICEGDFTTVALHPSEMASVLVNFLTNSVKAITRAKPVGGGKIKIRLWREHDTLLVDFFDNGDGISEENKDQIFNAFFTTTHMAASMGSESDELTGTGLGLKIVHDIMSSLDGDVYLVPTNDPYVTCFRIEIPCAELKEKQ